MLRTSRQIFAFQMSPYTRPLPRLHLHLTKAKAGSNHQLSPAARLRATNHFQVKWESYRSQQWEMNEAIQPLDG